jgi:hypothetical protein
MAVVLINSGVENVAAMSYNIVARAVEIFTLKFYTALLVSGVSFAMACTLARKAMKYRPERVSHLGTEVKVQDFMVPLCFTRLKEDEQDAIMESLPDDTTDLQLVEAPSFVGREDDMLRIESAVLIGDRPLLIHGTSGNGKTRLIRELAGWWRMTGLIVGSTHLHLASYNELDADIIEQSIAKDLEPRCDVDMCLSDWLSHTRYLIILDDFEILASLKGSKARNIQQRLTQLILQMTGVQAILIIVSRRKESYLSDCTHRYELTGL